MKPYQSPPPCRCDVTYTLLLSLSSCCSIMPRFLQQQKQHSIYANAVCVCVLAKAGQRAERQAAAPFSEVRMSNAARPLRRISRHHRGKTQRKMLEGGRWGKQHIVSHTSMQMPPLRWDCNFCSSADKNRFHYLELFSPHFQLSDLDEKTCINVLQTTGYNMA